ncbi:MAG: molecular chaperone DnaJ [Pseudarthrobacter sp.]|nr:molecular chaperone DnaJ [Pseudarthrobacter sp.]
MHSPGSGTPGSGKGDSGRPDAGLPDRAGLPDHYAALRVRASASQQEISRAYRSLMRTLHPDVGSGHLAGATADEDAAAQAHGTLADELQGIMQAFAVLRDPARRAAYDRRIAAARRPPHPQPGPQTTGPQTAGPQIIPVRMVRSRAGRSGPIIRITPVRWESGPWA